MKKRKFYSDRGFAHLYLTNRLGEQIKIYERSFADPPKRIDISIPIIEANDHKGKLVRIAAYTLTRSEAFYIALRLLYFSLFGKLIS